MLPPLLLLLLPTQSVLRVLRVSAARCFFFSFASSSLLLLLLTQSVLRVSAARCFFFSFASSSLLLLLLTQSVLRVSAARCFFFSFASSLQFRSCFVFRICFGFRVSCFGFPPRHRVLLRTTNPGGFPPVADKGGSIPCRYVGAGASADKGLAIAGDIRRIGRSARVPRPA